MQKTYSSIKLFFIILVIILISHQDIFAKTTTPVSIKIQRTQFIILEAFQRQKRGNPPLTKDMLDQLCYFQPDSGNFLLKKTIDTDDKHNEIASIAFAQIWNCLSDEQKERFFRETLHLFAEYNESYQLGDEAYIRPNYEVNTAQNQCYDARLPAEANLIVKTTTIIYLDDKQYGQPFEYTGPQASAYSIFVKKLSLGKHTFNFTTDYEISYEGKTLIGTAESEEYEFEIFEKVTTDIIAAEPNDTLDKLISNSFEIRNAYPANFRNQPVPDINELWGPQHTMNYYGIKIGIHTPVWAVKSPLPVGLCYKAEIILSKTGKHIRPYERIIVPAGEKHYWSHFMVDVEFQDSKEDPNISNPIKLSLKDDGQLKFANPIADANGVIPIKIILTPDRDEARISEIFDSYYDKTIVLEDMQMRIWLP